MKRNICVQNKLQAKCLVLHLKRKLRCSIQKDQNKGTAFYSDTL